MARTQSGTIAFVGSGEFLPPFAPVDRALLERIEGTPRVVIVPTASYPDGPTVFDRWARLGVEHYQWLGVAVEAVSLHTRADADKPAIADQIAQANFVFLSGGKPRYLLDTLRDTKSWAAIAKVFTSGGVVAGCSAGAMVLAGTMFSFPRWAATVPALGLAPDLLVIPHFDEFPVDLDAVSASMPPTLTGAGVDGSTALVGQGQIWTVLGRGGVTLFTPAVRRRCRAGETVTLPLTTA